MLKNIWTAIGSWFQNVMVALKLRKPARDTQVTAYLVDGQGNLQMATPTAFTIVPGTPRTMILKYTDPNGVNRPLASVPVASDPNKILTVTPLNNPVTNQAATPADGSFWFQIGCPVSAVIGSTVEVDYTAEADPTPGKQTIVGKSTGTVIAPEDTQVNATFQ